MLAENSNAACFETQCPIYVQNVVDRINQEKEMSSKTDFETPAELL